MSDVSRQVTTLSAREVDSMPIGQLLDVYQDQFRKVLPDTIRPEQFARVVLTAISEHPELNNADRRTLLNSCIKCANDGLLPDGRDAALVIFNTKIKDPRTNQESWIKAVQYMPMIAGIRRRMFNSGDVLEAKAAVVHKNDKFRYSLGDNPFIDHEPPSDLTVARGDIVGAYAMITLRNGQVIREVMRRDEIERRRNQSKAKNSLMWTTFYEEGCMKTVLRHAAKSAPQASQSLQLLERMLDREEEDQEQLEAPADRLALPRPTLVEFEQAETGSANIWVVVDLEGEEKEFPTPKMAAEVLVELIGDAKRRDGGRQALILFSENNQQTIRQLADDEETKPLAAEVLQAYREAMNDTDPLAGLTGGEQTKPADPKKPTRAKQAAQPRQEPQEQRKEPEPSQQAGGRLGLAIGPAEDVDVGPQTIDPTVPRLKRRDDGSPRWTEWNADIILAMREAAGDRLRQLWDAAALHFGQCPPHIKRDIERAHGERLQELAMRQ